MSLPAEPPQPVASAGAASGYLPGRHLDALDGVRGLAVILVLLEHLGGGRHAHLLPLRLLGNATRIGWSGVSLFFVLSGFLISGILWDSIGRAGWWRRFYVRRTLRIFPLYYAALAYAAVVIFIWHRDLLSRLWIYVFYVQNIAPFYTLAHPLSTTGVILDHFWSLAVEEQFYLVWPWVLMLFVGRRTLAMRVCIGLWLGSFALRCAFAYIHTGAYWMYFFSPSRMGELCLGSWLALWVRKASNQTIPVIRWARPVFFLATASLLTLAFYTRGDFEISNSAWTTFGILALSVLFVSLLAMCLHPGTPQRLFSFFPLRWIGRISYGIYIYHYLLFPIFYVITTHLFARSSTGVQNLAVMLVDLVGTFLVATLSFRYFETPFLRLKDRFAAPNSLPAPLP